MGKQDSRGAVPGIKPVRWWRKGRAWRRIVSDGTAAIVGIFAAVASWTHIVHVALVYGKQTQTIFGLVQVGYLYPLPVDGVMIVGVVAAADDRANGLQVRPWARVASWAGGILSVAAQVTSQWNDGWVARVIAAVPSGALIVIVEVLTKRGKAAVQGNPLGNVRWWMWRKKAALRLIAAMGTLQAPAPETIAETPIAAVALEVVPPAPVAPTVAPEPPTVAPVATVVTESAPAATDRPRKPSGRRRAAPRTTEGKPTQPTRAALAGPDDPARPIVESVTLSFDDGTRVVEPVNDGERDTEPAPV